MMNHWKLKFTSKSVNEKAGALDDVKKNDSNREIAKKFGIPKTHSQLGWKKEKNTQRLLGLAKRQRLKAAQFGNIDAATCKWFLSKQCENVIITGLILQTQALEFAKKLDITNFQASDRWLRNWKER